jgi:glycyl-tRNA synthetase alpha subunit
MSSFITKQGKTIVEKHNKKTLYPMLLKCHHHLQPLSENVIVDQGVDENYILNIFKMTRIISESTKELVSKEPLIFKRF